MLELAGALLGNGGSAAPRYLRPGWTGWPRRGVGAWDGFILAAPLASQALDGERWLPACGCVPSGHAPSARPRPSPTPPTRNTQTLLTPPTPTMCL